jgi:hypothetical protein
MSSATRIARLALLAASLLFVACAQTPDDGGNGIQGGPETCLTKALACGPHASCGYDADSRPVCRCDDGFYGDGTTCVATTACEGPSACSPNATCLQAGDQQLCECKAGFVDHSAEGEARGTTCDDVDECAERTTYSCPDHSACANDAGGYLCVCDAGYAPDAGGTACVLVDLCATKAPGTCQADSHCVNTTDDVVCVCDARFATTLDGCVPAEPVGAGLAHGCSLGADGGVSCWGRAGEFDLGTGTRMGGASAFVQLSQDGTCGFRRDGTLWCWWNGLALEGEQLVVDWRQVGGAGGWKKTVGNWGTRADGTIWSWNPGDDPVVPRQFGTETAWTDVCPGAVATCGTKLDGTAWCWAAGVPEPAQVGEAEAYTALSCAGGMTCGLRQDGRADCWWPEVIPPETEGGDPTLVAVPFALRAGVDAPTATVIDDVSEVTVGGGFVCALREAGGIWCAGAFGDPAGALRAGDPLVPNSEPWLGSIAPGTGWRSLAAGGTHACAIRHDDAAHADTAFCWGANDSGQLGRAGAGTLAPIPVTP